jgi:ketosteroid isomerase-like protein
MKIIRLAASLRSSKLLGVFVLLLTTVFLAGCPLMGEQESPDLTDDFYSASDADALSTITQWKMTAVRGEEVDAFMLDLADDAVILAPGVPAHEGHDDIRSWVVELAAKYAIHGDYEESEKVISGDWAFVRFHGVTTMEPRDGSAPSEETGKGINVYRREADGGWKIVWVIWNRDHPAAAQ